MPTLFPEEAKSIIEALLFVSGEPLSAKEIAGVLDLDEQDVVVLLKCNTSQKTDASGH